MSSTSKDAPLSATEHRPHSEQLNDTITLILSNPNSKLDGVAIAITVKRDNIKGSGFLTGQLNFLEREGKEKFELKVEPPVPERFLECLGFLAGDEYPPWFLDGTSLVDVLLNADYLGIEGLLVKCYER